MRKTLLAAGAAVLSLAAASPALADITILTEECAGCSNVHLFDDADATDNAMQGETFTGSGILVDFTGIEPLADTGPGMGVAWVGAADGTLTFLNIAIQGGFTFTELGFNLNETNTSGNPDWWVVVTGYDQFGPTSDIFNLSHNTAFHVLAENGQVMTNVAIQLMTSGCDPTDNDPACTPAPEGGPPSLDGVGQIKIDGVAAVIPEPATWAMMIMGFGAAGAMLRRRRAALV